MIRTFITFIMFNEYFRDSQEILWIKGKYFQLYRKLMGIIIWRVFTFEVVKYIIPTSTEKIRAITFDHSVDLLEASTMTNVYDSITAASLVASSKYLSKNLFEYRMNHYLEVLRVEKLRILELDDININCVERKECPFRNQSSINIRQYKINGKLKPPPTSSFQNPFNNYSR